MITGGKIFTSSLDEIVYGTEAFIKEDVTSKQDVSLTKYLTYENKYTIHISSSLDEGILSIDVFCIGRHEEQRGTPMNQRKLASDKKCSARNFNY